MYSASTTTSRVHTLLSWWVMPRGVVAQTQRVGEDDALLIAVGYSKISDSGREKPGSNSSSVIMSSPL